MLIMFMIKSQQLFFNVANLPSFPFLLARFCLGRFVPMFVQWVNNMFQPIPWEKQAFVFFLSFFLLFPFSFPFLPRTTWANCLYKESTIGLTSSLEKSKLLSVFLSFSFSLFSLCSFLLRTTCANVCTMSQGQKGSGRVSQTNRNWKGYKRWQFILELPPPLLSSVCFAIQQEVLGCC